ncbi:MAG: hypothetical protein OXF56_05875 [Rhodobacteraceae bacterium]|nr:hypothetical protein [Paracoccaceae bacterium]
MAVDSAAIATIERGFDKFLPLDFAGRTVQVGMWKHDSPIGTKTHIPFRRHQFTMKVKMFDHGDKDSDNAVDARRHLGPNWRDIVKSGASC